MLGGLYDALKGSFDELSGSFNDSARSRAMELIEDWMKIFPQLAEYGLEITSFSMSLALSPSINVELVGEHGNWTEEAIAERLARHKGETAIGMVFSTIRTAYRLQRRTGAELRDPLILKIIVKVPPEVRVVLGEPVLED